MPNATVRANARALPERTNRRAILGSAFAAGVAAALPAAAATTATALSEVDQEVLDLWQRRAELRAIADRLAGQVLAAENQLPALPKGRRGPRDLVDEFLRAFEQGSSGVSVLEEYAPVFTEFAESWRRRDSEKKRVGLDVMNRRCDEAWEAVVALENQFDHYLGKSVFALAAVLMVALLDDVEEIEGLNRATLAAIRPQLVGPIAEDADRVLADSAEALS